MTSGVPSAEARVVDGPSVSVIIAAFDSARWGRTVQAIRSVQAQTHLADELVLVVDHNDELLARALAEVTDLRVVSSTHARGASGARNAGVDASTGTAVAFLDDDAVADPKWLEALLAALVRPGVLGVGGRLVPMWPTVGPRWFPPEFNWVVGASYRGMPEVATPVRNVWGGSMALRRCDFDAIGGFREGFGKLGGVSRPEDTDLCLRLAAACPGRDWVYVPTAVARHWVPPAHTHPRFFLSRCWQEGRGKASLAGVDGPAALTSERTYARSLLLHGITKGLSERSVDGFLHSVAIIGGLSVAAGGLTAETLARVTHYPRTRPPRRRIHHARPR